MDNWKVGVTWCAAALFVGAVGSSARANFLTNGGLEKSAGSSVNAFNVLTVSSKNASVLPGWTISSGTVDLVPGAASGNQYWQDTQGSFSLDLVGTTGLGGIQQKVATTKGQSYVLTFDFAVNPQDGKFHESTLLKTLRVQAIGKSTVKENFTGMAGARTLADMQYIHETFTFTATATTTTLRLSAIAPSSLPHGVTAAKLYTGPVIDNLDLELNVGNAGGVPEPASLGVLGLGMAGLLVRRRRGIAR